MEDEYKRFGIKVNKIDQGLSFGVCISYDKYAKELKEITTVQPTTLFVIDGVIKKKLEGNSAYQNLKMVLDELGY